MIYFVIICGIILTERASCVESVKDVDRGLPFGQDHTC